MQQNREEMGTANSATVESLLLSGMERVALGGNGDFELLVA